MERAPAHLYFGCRKDNFDYIYKEDITTYASQGLVIPRIAFSRETGIPRTYVQDLLKQDSELVVDLLKNKGAFIYLCGSTKMG